jgi:hypothetical protein
MQAPAEIVSPKMGFGRFGDWQERSALAPLLTTHCLPSVHRLAFRGIRDAHRSAPIACQVERRETPPHEAQSTEPPGRSSSGWLAHRNAARRGGTTRVSVASTEFRLVVRRKVDRFARGLFALLGMTCPGCAADGRMQARSGEIASSACRLRRGRSSPEGRSGARVEQMAADHSRSTPGVGSPIGTGAHPCNVDNSSHMDLDLALEGEHPSLLHRDVYVHSAHAVWLTGACAPFPHLEPPAFATSRTLGVQRRGHDVPTYRR